jgi:hypothetical protein
MMRHVILYAVLLFAHVHGHHVELPETHRHPRLSVIAAIAR